MNRAHPGPQENVAKGRASRPQHSVGDSREPSPNPGQLFAGHAPTRCTCEMEGFLQRQGHAKGCAVSSQETEPWICQDPDCGVPCTFPMPDGKPFCLPEHEVAAMTCEERGYACCEGTIERPNNCFHFLCGEECTA